MKLATLLAIGLFLSVATGFAQSASGGNYKHQVPKGGTHVERPEPEYRSRGPEQTHNYKRQAPEVVEEGRIQNEPLVETEKSWSTERRNYKRAVPSKQR
ncbi:MAG: hypothetical protein ACK40G_13345 [Cytophagaceae bacterium]